MIIHTLALIINAKQWELPKFKSSVSDSIRAIRNKPYPWESTVILINIPHTFLLNAVDLVTENPLLYSHDL